MLYVGKVVKMLISLIEYAAKHGKDSGNVRRMAANGRFKTVIKIGRNWIIDSEEKFPIDGRITSGKYVGARKQ